MNEKSKLGTLGIEACVKDLLEAFEKYDEYFKDERKSG
jgi:hypothetical protein